MTFATEAEARQFARARVAEGLTVFAGTINPHSPRQIVTAEDIVQWLTAEELKSDRDGPGGET
jgi:hypothetical protein